MKFTYADIFQFYGNTIANTYTLNFSYGSGLTIPETGILLNNQIDNLTAKLEITNTYKLHWREK